MYKYSLVFISNISSLFRLPLTISSTYTASTVTNIQIIPQIFYLQFVFCLFSYLDVYLILAIPLEPQK